MSMISAVPESPSSPRPSPTLSPRAQKGIATRSNDTKTSDSARHKFSTMTVSNLLAAVNPDFVVTEALKKALDELLISLGFQSQRKDHLAELYNDKIVHSRFAENPARHVRRQKVEMRRPRHLEKVAFPLLKEQCAVDRANVHKYNTEKAKEILFKYQELQMQTNERNNQRAAAEYKSIKMKIRQQNCRMAAISYVNNIVGPALTSCTIRALNEIEMSIVRNKMRNEAQIKIRLAWRVYRFNKMKGDLHNYLNFAKYQRSYVAQRDEIEFQNRIRKRHERELMEARRGVHIGAVSVSFEPRSFDDPSKDAIARWLKKKFPI